MIGEHNQQVLGEWPGSSAAEVEALRQEGILQRLEFSSILSCAWAERSFSTSASRDRTVRYATRTAIKQ
jgi:hypothetical protein